MSLPQMEKLAVGTWQRNAFEEIQENSESAVNQGIGSDLRRGDVYAMYIYKRGNTITGNSSLLSICEVYPVVQSHGGLIQDVNILMPSSMR